MACPALPATPAREATLTIRPYFCLSIGRSAALLARKAPLRLVWITMSQSASLIRITSVSRVRPALLTRTSSLPHCLTTASTAVPGAPLSAKSACSAIAWWPSCDSSSTSESASACRLLYVMATDAPARPKRTAVARPMPRLPPVTRTTCSEKPSAMDGLEGGVHAGQILDIVDHGARENLLDQAGQGPPRTNLNVGVGAELLQPLDRLRPANWASQLADHQPADLERILVDLRISIEDLGATQGARRDLLPRSGEDLCRMGHQRRVERAADGQPYQALRAGRFELGAHGTQANLAARDDHLTRRVVVGNHDLSPAARACLFDGVVGQAEDGDHPAGRRCRRRHRPAARPDGFQRIEGIEGLGRHQPGELTHAVAGDQVRGEPAGAHQAKQGQAVKQDRRLGVAGRLWLGLGPVQHELAQRHREPVLGLADEVG